MANEIKYQGISVTGWTSTFNPLKKGPVVGKRIWNTLADLYKYINDQKDSAIPGILVSVINDTDENNGAYLVKTAAGVNGATEGTITKLSTGSTETVKLTIAEDSQDLAYIEDNKLHITDMRSRWETEF
jgi:hypothetical protein